MIKTALVISIILLSPVSFAATYYLSNHGSDAASGRSVTTPWCTLTKLADGMNLMQPGDSILFHRGSSFEGTLFITVSRLTIGAYGSGANPILSGAIKIEGWKVHTKNIWKATCPECLNSVALLLKNNKIQLRGRYPNRGFLFSNFDEEKNIITVPPVPFADRMTGSEVVVRSSRWTLDRLPVVSYRQGSFVFGSTPSYPLKDDFGFFIQNNLMTLDQPGEWYYDSSNRQLYYYSLTDPNKHRIEVGLLQVGLYAASLDGLVLKNITFKNYQSAGLLMENCHNINIAEVQVEQSGKNGIEILNCSNPIVERSVISDSQNNGVLWTNNTGGRFMSNSILRTGIIIGAAYSGNGTQIGLLVNGENSRGNLISGNTIDSTGYHGIDFRTRDTRIENNLITNFCIVKDDGGGIYTWHNRNGGNVVQNNKITNGIGAGEGTLKPWERHVSGIYIDDLSSHILLKENDISNCATAGIFLHNASIITLIGNVATNNGSSISNKEKGQLYIKLDAIGLESKTDNYQIEAMENRWVSESDAFYCVYISRSSEYEGVSLGSFTQNSFELVNAKLAVALQRHQPGLCGSAAEYTLPEWQSTSQMEHESVFAIYDGSSYFKQVGNNLIGNGDITMNSQGWMSWPSMESVDRDTKILIDGPSLRIKNAPGANGELLVYHAGFGLQSGKIYRLKFMAMSTKPNQLEFVPLMANTPWSALGNYACFDMGPSYQWYTYYFQPSLSNAEARINFKSNSTWWMDDISLYEVEKAH